MLHPLTGNAAAERDRLIDAALELPRAEHARFLAAQPGVAADVLAEVARTLAELERDDGFLAPGAVLRSTVFEGLWDDDAGGGTRGRALADGARVGPYVVTGLLGVGGMGEVYRARDARLGRLVALKVLPHHVRQQPGRAARLRREARVLAALSHPHIATVHDVVESGDVLAVVLELVERETLAARLTRGPVHPEDALAIARQVADGLSAAHDRGIVHCDLKPGNIGFDRAGRVRILDFGIATGACGSGPSDSRAVVLTTTPVLVGAGIGTARYMSPEQLRGEEVDRRADVWAFGCLCYELLTGVAAFGGDTTADVMARVLGDGPDLDRLPAVADARWRRLIAACLAKDVTARPDDMRSVLTMLDAIGERSGVDLAGLAHAQRDTRGARHSSQRGWWVALGVALGSLAAAGAMWIARRGTDDAVVRFDVAVPASDELVTGSLPTIALAPDGSSVVYRARRDGRLQLFRLVVASGASAPIPGTADATGPFFSPDGHAIGFWRAGALHVTELDGGGLTRVCACGTRGAAASWGDRGTIVFAPTPNDGLYRVSAQGGPPLRVTRVNVAGRERSHGFPDVLPGERAALFSIASNRGGYVALVDLASGEVTRLVEGSQPRYLSSGFLIFVRGDALWAAPFDPTQGRLGTRPREVVTGLDLAPSAHLAIDHRGTLVYVPAPDFWQAESRRELVFVRNWIADVQAVFSRAR